MVMFSSTQYTVIEIAVGEPYSSTSDLCCPVRQPMAAYGYLNSLKLNKLKIQFPITLVTFQGTQKPHEASG